MTRTIRSGSAVLLVLALLLGFVLAGCEDTQPTPTQPAGTPTTAPTEAPSITEAPDPYPTLENPNLKYVTHTSVEQYETQLAENPDALNAFFEVREMFEAKYGGTFELIVVPWADITAKIVSMQAADDAPNMMLLSDQSFPLVAAKNILQPLPEELDLSWVPQFYIDAYTYKGKKYGVGSGKPSLSYIAYNKDMFELEGLPDPFDLWKEGKWDYDAFYNAGSTLTKDFDNDGQIDQWGFCTWGTYVSQLIQSNGARLVLFEEDGAYSGLKDTKTIEALTFIQKMLKMPGGFMNPANYQTFQADFIAGKLAMTHGVYLPKPAEMKDTMAIVPFPHGPSGEPMSMHVQIFGYGSPTGATNFEGVLAFLYMMEQEVKTNPVYTEIGKRLYGDEAFTLLFEEERKYEYSNDRNFADVWSIYWYIADDLQQGIPPATVAETRDPEVQAALDKSFND